uniref:Putative secreted protein n=1 Tax=Ixodes ricinus TaxID=34613 RepID=A0A6B0UR45_IXORI
MRSGESVPPLLCFFLAFLLSASSFCSKMVPSSSFSQTTAPIFLVLLRRRMHGVVPSLRVAGFPGTLRGRLCLAQGTVGAEEPGERGMDLTETLMEALRPRLATGKVCRWGMQWNLLEKASPGTEIR